MSKLAPWERGVRVKNCVMIFSSNCQLQEFSTEEDKLIGAVLQTGGCVRGHRHRGSAHGEPFLHSHLTHLCSLDDNRAVVLVPGECDEVILHVPAMRLHACLDLRVGRSQGAGGR